MAVRIRVGELARNHGLTISALAKRAGVAYNTAHALYTARATRIDLETLDRISTALEVEPGEVFSRHPARETGTQLHGRAVAEPMDNDGGRPGAHIFFHTEELEAVPDAPEQPEQQRASSAEVDPDRRAEHSTPARPLFDARP